MNLFTGEETDDLPAHDYLVLHDHDGPSLEVSLEFIGST